MAEGGPLPDGHVNKDNTALTYQLLECPICLEQMRQPKSLPCLHSFCEECLSTYIVTDLSGEMAAMTSFPCPVCRQITSPVNHSEGKETWAQQFPTNSLTQHFNNHKEMADTPLNCGPCKKTKNQETPAKFLCKAIGTLFCEHCKINFHDVVHEACEILTNLGTSYDATWKGHMSTSCSTHNEKMDSYCEDHEFIGCNKCIITEHRRCLKVMTFKEYCEHQKKNSRLDDMDNSLEKANNCLESMLNALNQVESLQKCQDGSLNSISNLRQRINAYLDKKLEEITKNMIAKDKAEKTKVDLSKQKCNRLRAAIQNTREASQMAIGMEDHLGMIQLFIRGQAEIRACNDLIDDIKRSPKSISMKHDIDSSHIIIDQSSTLTLGRILVEEQPCTIITAGVEYIQNVDLLSNSRAKKIGQCRIKIPSETDNCTAHGVLLMPTGNIIVSDYLHGKLKMFSVKGQYLDELESIGKPHDVCSVDDDTVAVAVTSKQVGIHVVKVQPSMLTLSTVIKVSTVECQGLAFMDGHFMVSTSKAIHSVTMDGKIEKVQTLSAPCWHLTSDLKKNKTFACLQTSTVDDIVVTRLHNGIQIYGVDERVVKNAMGVDVDREGNVYVCGQESNKVLQVSVDGTKVRELLTSKDGIDKPRAISVCGDKFVVTNESSGRNEIQIYQLC